MAEAVHYYKKIKNKNKDNRIWNDGTTFQRIPLPIWLWRKIIKQNLEEEVESVIILWRSSWLESLKKDDQQVPSPHSSHSALSSSFPWSLLTNCNSGLTFICLEQIHRNMRDKRQQTSKAHSSGALQEQDMAGFPNSLHALTCLPTPLIQEAWCGFFSHSSFLCSLLS